jgi:hypothetical protein
MSFPPGTEMFQFPGFASCDLWIQSQDTWLAQLMGPTASSLAHKQLTVQHISRTSGGLPHSEIFGSKPIPGSPKLIAGYHVLHRLLLPRHPPNALLALDPIQRRTGLPGAPLCSAQTSPPRLTAQPRSEVIHFPLPGRVRPGNIRLVYLTWNKTAFGQAIRPPQVTPTLGGTSGSDVSLSSQLSNSVRIGRENTDPSALQSHPKDWWVEEDSNLRPHAYQACALTT